MVFAWRVYGVYVADKQLEPTLVQLAVDPTCGDADTLVQGGLNVSGARLISASTETANPDIRIRVFRPSARIKRGFDGLEPPLFDADHKPVPRVVAWFSEVASFLRFLEIEPRPREAWQFSLMLAMQRNEAAKRTRLGPTTRGRATVINLTEGDPVSVHVELENKSPDAEGRRVALTVPLAAQMGLFVEASGWHGTWRMDLGEHEYIAVLLATSSSR